MNCVCGGWTSLSPRELLTVVKGVERTVGREPSFPNGPRSIDVDILFYEQQKVIEAGLEIPHPRLTERAFVLVPLAEIASEYIHPVLRLTVKELLQNMGAGEQSTGSPTGGVQMVGTTHFYPGNVLSVALDRSPEGKRETTPGKSRRSWR